MFDILFSGLLALAGVAMGQYFARKSSVEQHSLNKRKETTTRLQYAIDLIVIHKSVAGVSILKSLRKSKLLQEEDIELVNNLYNDFMEGEIK